MKLRANFSPGYVLTHALRTFWRFPYAVLAAVAAGVLIDLLRLKRIEQDFEVGVAVAALFIALPMMVAASLVRERLGRERAVLRSLCLLGGMLFPLVYYAVTHDNESGVSFFRTVQLWLAAHLLVAFAPFIGRRDKKLAFWSFNKTLFIRFFLSMLYSAVLSSGIALIYGALTYLFGVRVSNEVYIYTGLFCVFVFHPLHFLAGVPRPEDDAVAEIAEYPRGLKVFAQYLLVPLIGINLMILSAYFLKIVGTWTWPRGGLAWMISMLASAGFFTLLLLDPVLRRVGSEWLQRFSKVFYALLIPLEVMLLAALSRRLGDYGLTESRYMVLVFGLWCLGVAIYFLFSRAKDIRWVPVSLFLVVLLSSFGPWGAYESSMRSQRARLEKLLEESGALVAGKVVEKAPKASDMQASSVLYYLVERHGLEPFADWFAPGELERAVNERAGDFLSADEREKQAREYLAERLGLAEPKTIPAPLKRDEFRLVQMAEGADGIVDLGGHRRMVDLLVSPEGTDIAGTAYDLRLGSEGRKLVIRKAGRVVFEESFDNLIGKVAKSKSQQIARPVSELTIALQGSEFRGIFVVENLLGTYIRRNRSDIRLIRLNGTLIFD